MVVTNAVDYAVPAAAAVAVAAWGVMVTGISGGRVGSTFLLLKGWFRLLENEPTVSTAESDTDQRVRRREGGGGVAGVE